MRTSWLAIALVGCGNPYAEDTADTVDSDTTADTDTVDTETGDTDDTVVITDRCVAFAERGAVTADETLPSPPAFRNDRPAVGVSPDGVVHVAHSVAENGYHGFWDERTSTGWTEEATPFDIATAGIVYDDAGDPLVIAYGGDGDTGIWRRDGSEWAAYATPTGYAGGSSSTFGRGSDGTLHALFTPSGNYVEIGYATYDGASWTYERLGDVANFVSAAALAVAETDKVHAVYWDSTAEDGWLLKYRAPNGQVSTGWVAGTWVLESPWVDMAADAGSPMAIVDPQRYGAHREVAALVGKQTPFTEIVIATGTEPQYCGEPMGGTCHVDYEQVYPIAVATDPQGGAWWAWSKVHVEGTYVSVCQDMFCYWAGDDVVSDGTLSVSCMDDQSNLHHRQILDVYGPGSGDALVTGDTLHLATYDWDRALGTAVVRYTQVALTGE